MAFVLDERRRTELQMVRRVRDRIDRDHASPLDVPTLARGEHVSAGHLSRSFKEAYGESPYSYLMTRRIERAMALLRSTDLTVTEICFTVGCGSLGTFTTRFGELVGLSPTACLGRHRARFAFPDDLAPTLRPLVNRLREKARKSTPQGRRIDEVWEIRVRVDPDWDAAQQSIELVFLVDPRSLPPQPVESELPASIHSQIQSVDVQRLAELLDDQALDAGSRNVTWQRLADAWSSFAKPAGSIVEVSGVAVPINEFTRFDEFTAPQLDLDYLSD